MSDTQLSFSQSKSTFIHATSRALRFSSHPQPLSSHSQLSNSHSQPFSSHSQPFSSHSQPFSIHSQPSTSHSQPCSIHEWAVRVSGLRHAGGREVVVPWGAAISGRWWAGGLALHHQEPSMARHGLCLKPWLMASLPRLARVGSRPCAMIYPPRLDARMSESFSYVQPFLFLLQVFPNFALCSVGVLRLSHSCLLHFEPVLCPSEAVWIHSVFWVDMLFFFFFCSVFKSVSRSAASDDWWSEKERLPDADEAPNYSQESEALRGVYGRSLSCLFLGASVLLWIFVSLTFVHRFFVFMISKSQSSMRISLE